MSDGLIPDGEALFDPSRFAPQFSDAQIVGHMERTLRLLEEIDPPEDMRVHVFGVVQAMCSSMSPIEGKVTVVSPEPALLTPTSRRH
jgi:hypothetical protein